MNKILLKVIFIVLAIGMTACSYKPIFSEKNYNFQIDELILSGDKDINRVIDRKLTMIRKSQDSNKKNFSVIVDSIKNVEIVSNDSKGDPLKFEISIIVTYKIKENNNVILEREIEKSNIYNNKTDKFELDQNEKNIIINLSEKISDNIISSIINLNDN